MTDQIKNGRTGTMELFRTVAQLLIIPTIALLWAMWGVMDIVKERVVRMDVTLTNHISTADNRFSRVDRDSSTIMSLSQKMTILEHDIVELKQAIKEMGASLDSHRQKSDYDPKSRR